MPPVIPDVPLVLLRVDRAPERATSHPRHRHAPLMLKYLQAGIRHRLGIRAPILDGWIGPLDARTVAQACHGRSPRVAVIEAYSWCLAESIRLASALRQLGVLTVAVGQQAAHAARSPITGWAVAYDLTVTGEPETALPELLGKLLDPDALSHVVSAWAQPIAVEVEVERIALPHWEADELRRYPFPWPATPWPVRRWAYVQTSWGCPRACRHCSLVVRKSTGRVLRKRPVADVLEEVARLRSLGAEGLIFEDDSLFTDRRHVLQLCAGLSAQRTVLPWVASVRPDELDGEVVVAARAAGAALFKLGVDSGHPRIVEAMGKTHDGAAWRTQCAEGVALLDRHGIESLALFVSGYGDQPDAEAQASRDFAQQLGTGYVQVQVFQPYPDMAPEGASPQPEGEGDYHYPPARRAGTAIHRTFEVQRGFYRAYYGRVGYWRRHLPRYWRHYAQGAGLRLLVSAWRYLRGGGWQ